MEEKTFRLHQTSLTDNYIPLENYRGSVASNWIEEQNLFTERALGSLPQFRWMWKQISSYYERSEVKKPPFKVPDGTRYFQWSQWFNGSSVLFSKKDENSRYLELLRSSEWKSNMYLQAVSPSRDGSMLAYGVDRLGQEDLRYFLMDCETLETKDLQLKGSRRGGIQWLPGDKGFLYYAHPKKGEVKKGQENYWCSVYFHKMGTPHTDDVKIFHDPDHREHMHYAEVTHDGKFVILTRTRATWEEKYLLSSTNLFGDPVPIVQGFKGHYQVLQEGKNLYILTDEIDPMGQVYKVRTEDPRRQNWKKIIEAPLNLNFNEIVLANGKIYVHALSNTYSRIRSYGTNGMFLSSIPLPGYGTASVSGEWDEKDIHIGYTSFFHPSSLYRLDEEKGKLVAIHEPIKNVKERNYRNELVWYKSADGTPVSMQILKNRNLETNSENPCYLTAYGGFNIPYGNYFDPFLLMWIDAGGMVAIPHIRGGGEYGRLWHESVIGACRQQTSFDDFISAAEWLIGKKYTQPDNLCIKGGSRGGLLVGVAGIKRPDLFRAVHSYSGPLDMIRQYGTKFGFYWTEEFGDPFKKEDFDCILAYSPYHNIRKGGSYPTMLVTAGANDARVDPMNTLKFVARLQQETSKKNAAYLFLRWYDGHFESYDWMVQSYSWCLFMELNGMHPERSMSNTRW